MLPLLAAGAPWAPMMAWLVASPLNSPNTFALLVGALGLPFAIAQITAAVGLGIAAGLITGWLERRGWLRGQARLGAEAESEPLRLPAAAVSAAPAASVTAAGVHQRPLVAVPIRVAAATAAPARCCGGSSSATVRPVRLLALWPSAERRRAFRHGLTKRSTRQLLRNFALFIVVASAVRQLVPTSWIGDLFGATHLYAVPLAALAGIPLYTSNSSSIPLVQSLVEMGMGQGAAMALLIAGAGTSLPAMAGLLAVARWRLVALYVVFIYVGAVLSGIAVEALGLVGPGL